MTKRRSDFFETWQKAKKREEMRWQIMRARIHKEAKLISRQLREHRGELPDNEEGRDVLEALVRSAPDMEMRNLIFCLAPWATHRDVAQLLAHVTSMEPKTRHCTRTLGELMQFTKAERDTMNRLFEKGPRRRQHKSGFYMVKPCDMTDREISAEKHDRKRKRQEAYRRKRGQKSRRAYLAANQTSRAAPWEAEGIHKSTWYRRRKRDATSQGRHLEEKRDRSATDNTLSISAGTDLSHGRCRDAGKVLPFQKPKTSKRPKP